MPYILPSQRKDRDLHSSSPGNLHYIISQAINQYLTAGDRVPNYTLINDVMGVLACAQAEVYRRIAVPYEDQKILENGDVYNVEA